MAPSADCAANLFCSEDAFGCLSDDDTGSFFEDGHADASAKALLLDDPADVQAALSLLVETEVWHRPQADYLHKFHSKDLDASSRQNAIDWLYEARALYNFSPLTAALSVNYLDRFLSRHHLLPNGKTWMLQLVSVACLSLAAKMEETEVPLLLDLQVGHEYVFEPRTIQRMELLVLSTLDWRMSSVTPFAYMDYFIQNVETSNSARCFVRSRVNELILCALKELAFLEFRPSSIAAAAALCAIQQILPVQFAEFRKLLLSILPLIEDDVERCCLAMLGQFLAPSLSIPNLKNDICGNYLPQSPMGVLEVSFSSDCESNIRSIESSQSLSNQARVSISPRHCPRGGKSMIFAAV